MCLATDQFLNDVITDFYLKYLLLNLPKEKQDKVQIFSTFFYKRLMTKPLKASRKLHPNEVQPNLTQLKKGPVGLRLIRLKKLILLRKE